MYYTLTPDTKGNVMILNQSSARVAVTNLKVSGLNSKVTPQIAVATTAAVEDETVTDAAVESIPMFLTVTRSTMAFAESFASLPESSEPVIDEPAVTDDPNTGDDPNDDSGETEEPAPTPTPTPSIHSILRQVLSSFVRSLFGSMSRLFGRY